MIFEGIGGKTKMSLHCVVQQADEDVMVAVTDMEAGWSGSLDRLRDLLPEVR